MSGTVQPGKRLVTVSIYEGTKKVGTRRLRVSRDTFSGNVALPGSGQLHPDRQRASRRADRPGAVEPG